MFEQDIGSEYFPPDTVSLRYEEATGLWVAGIGKKYDASTLHYYLNITDYSTGETIQTEPATYSYTTPFNFKYTPCLIVFFIVFAAFEILMRYGKTGRFSRKEEPEDDGKNTDEKEDSSK